MFNLFRKPKVAPPSALADPELGALNPVIQKQEPIFERFLNTRPDLIEEVKKYRQAFIDVILLNFQSISYFMDKVVYKGRMDQKRDFEEKIKSACTLAASCGWMIGREWALKDPNLLQRLKNNISINTDDVPFDAMEILSKAGYFPYWFFAMVFTGYYDSDYGNRVRGQKEGHLKDTYQAIMKGMLMCFLSGVKSLSY